MASYQDPNYPAGPAPQGPGGGQAGQWGVPPVGGQGWAGQPHPGGQGWAGQQGGAPPLGVGQWTEAPGASSGRSTPSSPGQALALTAGVAGVILTFLALLIPINGKMPLTELPAWGLFGLAAAIATVVGVLLTRPGGPAYATPLARGGAGAVGLFWVLIGVPTVPSTNSLLITLAAVGAAAAVWLSGRENS